MFYLAVCALVTEALLTFELKPYQCERFGKSAATNGLYVVVTGYKNPGGTGAPYRPGASEPVVFTFFTVWEESLALNLCSNPSRLCQVELNGNTGNVPKKTRLGRSYGTRYSQNIAFTGRDSYPATAGREPYYLATGGMVSGTKIDAPDQLFRIHEPGVYTLKLTFQTYRFSKKGGFQLVRLPPAELPILVEAGDIPSRDEAILCFYAAGLLACAAGVGWLVWRRLKPRSRGVGA